MPTKVHKNTFSKGMNKDISNLYMPKESYRDAKNFRISTSENSTIGILENVKGNSEIYNRSNYPIEINGSIDLDQVIVGGASLDNYLIFFTYNDNSNTTRIFRATIIDEEVTNMELLWSDLGKDTENKMNLSLDHTLKVVARKENDNIEKIYWVDYNNYLRYANIGEYLTSDKEVRSADNIYVSAKYFNTVSEFDMANLKLTGIGGGNLKAGMVQYSYQLYNRSGSETSFAPATGLYHITSSSESRATSSEYKGSPEGEYTGKSLSFEIDLSDSEYDSVRIVSIHYESYNQVPVINIVTEQGISSSGTVLFTDNGSGYVGSYSLEEFTAISGLYKAKDIAAAKNFLFIANIKQNNFDVEDYDARAYRFTKGGQETTTTTTTVSDTSIETFNLSDGAVTMIIESNSSVEITIQNIGSVMGISNLTNITGVSNHDSSTSFYGEYDGLGAEPFSFSGSSITYTSIFYNSATGTLSFVVNVDGDISSSGMPEPDGLLSATLSNVDISYTYTSASMETTEIPAKARLVESNGDVYFVYTDGTWDKVEYDGTPITSGTDWNIPENADLENLYNVTEYDGSRRAAEDTDTRSDYLGNFKYGASGNLGGTGKNISYTFDFEELYIDEAPESFRVYTNFDSNNLVEDIGGYNGYFNPQNTAEHRSYQRDEIYRFGIVFFDKFGRESTVKWIGDIRMPGINDGSESSTPSMGDWYVGNADPSNGSKTKALFPKFEIRNYPDGATAYKIVRAERTPQDRTVILSGLVRPTGHRAGEEITDAMQPYHATEVDTIEAKSNLIEFISPEISFYKDFSPINNDYLELHELGGTLLKGLDPNGANGEDFNAKYRSSYGISYSDSSYSYNNLSVLDGKILSYLNTTESNNINGNTFYTDYAYNGERAGMSTALMLDVAEDLLEHLPSSGQRSYNMIKYGIYRRHIFESQYGGPDYFSRSNIEYISASEVQDIPGSLETTYCNAVHGDTFINMYDHTALYYSRDDNCVFLNFIFPVESSINLSLRHDDCFSKVYRTIDYDSYQNITEGGDPDIGYSALYQYNTVYSQENTVKKYFPRPAGDDFQELSTFNTRIIVSERKFNGESSDSWLKFLPNNFIDVDGGYGEITNIMNYNNNLLFWQPSAVGLTNVDPRSLITDNNPGSLVLGTGSVLTRFDYLSTNIGNSNTFNIVNAPRGIYWYDSILNTIARYNGEYIERLSKLKGVQSYLNDSDFDNAIIEYDPKYDEILISLFEGNANGTTLVYNELTDSFTGFYTYLPSRYFRVRDKIISSGNNDHLYMHGTSNSNYGTFYGIYNDSTLLTLVNSDMDHMKVFDGINYPSYSYNNSGVLDFTDTFESYKAYDSYQNTDEIPLVFGDNISRKKGMWSFHIARNDVTEDPETNPDIFDNSNLGNSNLFKSRMRDHFLVLDFTYNNTNDNRFTVPYINTKYRIFYR